ncbi:hypothetical protein LK494_02980 [Anaerovorax odorimutans]|nr:hypothetical protein [Anaerovorax odorimutans]
MKSSRKHFLIIIAVVVALSAIPSFTFAASKLKAPTLYNHSAGIHSIKNYWSKVKGAKGYHLYRSTKKSGKYKRIATTKKGSYTDKKLKEGKKYYYKVRAYKSSKGKKKYGKFSAAQAAKPCMKDTFTVTCHLKEHKSSSEYQSIKITNKSARTMTFANHCYFYPKFGGETEIAGIIFSASNTNTTYPSKVILKPGKSVTIKIELEQAYSCTGNSMMNFDVIFSGYTWGAFFTNNHGYQAVI